MEVILGYSKQIINLSNYIEKHHAVSCHIPSTNETKNKQTTQQRKIRIELCGVHLCQKDWDNWQEINSGTGENLSGLEGKI